MKKVENRKGPVLKKSEVLNYKNPEIIARFCKNHSFPRSFGEMVFKDLMRYFYLRHLVFSESKKRNKQFTKFAPIISGMAVIDEMWHTFIQYTREYELFSKRFFGYYIHHEPERVIKGRSRRRSSITVKEFQSYCETVWELYGEEVVNRWFSEYPKKYSRIKLTKFQLASQKKE